MAKQLPSISGWECKLEGNQLVLFSANSYSSGIRINVNKGARTLSISGWFDNCVGIEGSIISLDEITALFKKGK